MGAIATICLGFAFSWVFFSVTYCFKRTLLSFSTSAFSATTFFWWHLHQWVRCSFHSLSDLLVSPTTASNLSCIATGRSFWRWSVQRVAIAALETCLFPMLFPHPLHSLQILVDVFILFKLNDITRLSHFFFLFFVAFFHLATRENCFLICYVSQFFVHQMAEEGFYVLSYNILTTRWRRNSFQFLVTNH